MNKTGISWTDRVCCECVHTNMWADEGDLKCRHPESHRFEQEICFGEPACKCFGEADTIKWTGGSVDKGGLSDENELR